MSLLKKIVSAPFIALAWLLEFAMSRRGMPIIAITVFAFLSWGPWLRPPISRDFRGPHLSWGILPGSSINPFDGRDVPRDRPTGGIGFLLLTSAAAAAVAVIVWPKTTPWVFGGLLVLSSAAVAAECFNHPSLIEYLDIETGHRIELRFLFATNDGDLLTGMSPDRSADLRDPKSIPKQIGWRPDEWLAGWRYQLFGPWAIIVAGVALVSSVTGGWRKRLVVASGCWILCSCVSAGVCWRRIHAEYHLAKATAAEQGGHYEEAVASAESAAEYLHCLREMRRYWLITGRLDYRLNRPTLAASYFRAHQRKQRRSFAEAESALGPLTEQPDTPRVFHDLLGEILSHQATIAIREERPSAAAIHWQDSVEIAPWRTMNWVGVAVAMTMTSPARAADAEQMLVPRFDQIGDRLVRSDVASMIGDAYFRDGKFGKAREMYEMSMSIFSLPKYVNLNAQEGMLGM